MASGALAVEASIPFGVKFHYPLREGRFCGKASSSREASLQRCTAQSDHRRLDRLLPSSPGSPAAENRQLPSTPGPWSVFLDGTDDRTLAAKTFPWGPLFPPAMARLRTQETVDFSATVHYENMLASINTVLSVRRTRTRREFTLLYGARRPTHSGSLWSCGEHRTRDALVSPPSLPCVPTVFGWYPT